MTIPIKTEKEIQIMRKNGKNLAGIMEKISKKVAPGVKSQELNELAEKLIIELDAKPSFKNYNGFPAALCVSINEEIVHGTPYNKTLKHGDIVSLDLGIYKNGFHSDMAITLPVGEISYEAKHLIKTTKKALKLAIRNIKTSNTFGDISNIIQRHIESQGHSVVRELCGHGIGRKLHEDPEILNYGKRRTGPKIKQGMVFCIEPMAAIGKGEIKKGKDCCAYTTIDKTLSAHFEHTIAVTKKGAEILTKI